MNQRIALIITTDFLCWIPFIVVCTLHSVELVDATPWYSWFSTLILPLNSIINPLIYDDTIAKLIVVPVKKLINIVFNSGVSQSLQNGFTTGPQETVELTHMSVQDEKPTVTVADVKLGDGKTGNTTPQTFFSTVVMFFQSNSIIKSR